MYRPRLSTAKVLVAAALALGASYPLLPSAGADFQDSDTGRITITVRIPQDGEAPAPNPSPTPSQAGTAPKTSAQSTQPTPSTHVVEAPEKSASTPPAVTTTPTTPETTTTEPEETPNVEETADQP